MRNHALVTRSVVRRQRLTRWFGIVSLLAGVGFAVSILSIPASATSRSKHVVHAGAYVAIEHQQHSLNGVPNLLILKTPPLPAGNYVAAASINAFIPTVLSGSSPNTDDYLECYINELPNKSTTIDDYNYGYNGEFALSVSNAFLKVPAGTQLGLYCYDYEPSSNGIVNDASLTVTPYSTISVNG
jgi:hypothetical protein